MSTSRGALRHRHHLLIANARAGRGAGSARARRGAVFFDALAWRRGIRAESLRRRRLRLRLRRGLLRGLLRGRHASTPAACTRRRSESFGCELAGGGGVSARVEARAGGRVSGRRVSGELAGGCVRHWGRRRSPVVCTQCARPLTGAAVQGVLRCGIDLSEGLVEASKLSAVCYGGLTKFVQKEASPLNCQYVETVQAGRPKKRFLFGHLFLNLTNVCCAKKRVGHACICPRMVTG